MERLKELDVPDRGIQDLAGLQFATNMDRLVLGPWGEEGNQISDLSPIAGLINLRTLWINNNPVSDISPLKGLKNLTDLRFRDAHVLFDLSPIAGLVNLKVLDLFGNNVSDLSPLAGLINLEWLTLERNNISDLSPLAGLINLEYLFLSGNDNISDLSPLAGLINLKQILSWGESISDLSPLAGLTKLEDVNICGANLSDLTPLASLTSLKELYLRSNGISDISPLAELTGLTRLNLAHNEISDISSLVGLINLEWLRINDNGIFDFSPLDGLRENIKLLWYDNPGYPKGGPKIEGPWLWVVLPDIELDDSTDLLSEASGGVVTETEIATHGATEGKSVGTSTWVSHKLPPTGRIKDMLKGSIHDTVIYGSISLYSPQEQDTTIYVGSNQELKVWLNGDLIHRHGTWDREWSRDYTDFFPVTLKQGRNVLLVAFASHANGFFGFESGTEYTVSMGVGYTFSQTPIHTGDTFTLNIRAENVTDLAGWQFDIAFDPAILEAINMSEGDFLKTDGGTTFFQGGSIDNAAGKITGLSAARLSTQGVTGTGTLIQVRFKAKSAGETELELQRFQFGSTTGDSIPAGPHEIRITVEERLTTGDVNRDGVVSILDLILVAQQLGGRVPAGSAVDVNGDGVVSILDLIRVAQGIAGSPAAPVALNLDLIGAVRTESAAAATIEAWIAEARLADDGSLAFKQGIENLQTLLRSLIPESTALLASYPNPFNPETWIPYWLAVDAFVTLTIYDGRGQVVRVLDVGYQVAAVYESRSKAIYWDGRNEFGERVASGLYFYTLTAGDYSATRKMFVIK